MLWIRQIIGLNSSTVTPTFAAPNRFQECLILEPIFISFRGPKAPGDRLFNPVQRWLG